MCKTPFWQNQRSICRPDWGFWGFWVLEKGDFVKKSIFCVFFRIKGVDIIVGGVKMAYFWGTFGGVLGGMGSVSGFGALVTSWGFGALFLG